MDRVKARVLVFPAGEVNSIELHDALATNVNIELFGASSIDRHGEFKFGKYISGLPLISDEGFIDELNRVIVENEIDIVIPAHDTVSYFFSINREAIKTKVLVPEGDTAEICRYKSKAYTVLEGLSFLPKVYNNFERLPVFIKPDDGQGGQGAKLIQEAEDIPQKIQVEKYIICEYLPGMELTVDCFTDKDGGLLVVSPRTRKRTMAGVAVSSDNVSLSVEIKGIAEAINGRIKFLGLWFFQVKENADGEWRLLEVSTRVASSMSLTRSLGHNLPLMSVYAALGRDVSALSQSYNVRMDRTLISRYKLDFYFDTVYLDFDDTLVVKGKVYLPAIWLVYQLNNQNKKVVLMTRHEFDIDKALDGYGISKSLFSKIIHIKSLAPKSDFISEVSAVFIDNSYHERKDVLEKHGIPVFDVDAIEVLMDWRV